MSAFAAALIAGTVGFLVGLLVMAWMVAVLEGAMIDADDFDTL